MYRMFKKSISLFFISFFCILTVIGQGIEFFEGTWEEALAKADQEKKIIFVDAYAEWCGPCKVMAKKVFTQKEVGDFYNENFINMKLDMEKSESTSFKRKFSVSAFPTLFFVNEKEEEVHKSVGGKQADALIELGKVAMSKDDRSGDFAVKYEEGDRSFDLVLGYVKALNDVNKPSLKITNEYLRSKPDISKEQRAEFLFYAITESDSKWFSELMENKKYYEKTYGEKEFEDRINMICWKTVQKATEFEYYDLVIEAKDKLKDAKIGDAKLFSYEADMYYGKEMKEAQIYFKALDNYYKKYAKKDPVLIKTCITDLGTYFETNKDATERAEKFGKDLIKKEESVENLMLYSNVLYKNGKTEKALEEANKSLALAKKEGKPAHTIERFIRFLKSS